MLPSNPASLPVQHEEPLKADEDEVSEKDSLHIMSLAGLPLVTPGLRRARLIKNSHLDGVVELFTDAQAGSGQVVPEDLPSVFQFDASNRSDLPLIKNLSLLSSYDVYSLRVELRRLGINVENVDDLRLSEARVRELAPHMAVFTHPLICAVFGSDGQQKSLSDLLKLLASPDVDVAQRNLAKLSQQMHIELTAIPKFLEDYGDVYLSLAYYQSCLDALRPKLRVFLDALADLKADRNLMSDQRLIATCKAVERKIGTITWEVGDILSTFRTRTQDMWDEMAEGSFQHMERMITDYQSKVGGALCVIAVKLDAWAERFPHSEIGGPVRRAEFVMNTMSRGLERVESIDYRNLA